jgi:hypothetical protein
MHLGIIFLLTGAKGALWWNCEMRTLPVTTEPQKPTAGDTWQWQRTLDDYPASDGWTLRYHLRGPQIIDFDASPNEDDFEINVPAATTAAYAPGVYAWQAAVYDADGNRFTVDQGTLEILQNVEAISGSYDGRSVTKQILDAVTACLLGTATKDDQEMQIHGRSLKRRNLTELQLLKAEYERLYRLEQIRAGQIQPQNDVQIKFEGPRGTYGDTYNPFWQ